MDENSITRLLQRAENDFVTLTDSSPQDQNLSISPSDEQVLEQLIGSDHIILGKIDFESAEPDELPDHLAIARNYLMLGVEPDLRYNLAAALYFTLADPKISEGDDSISQMEIYLPPSLFHSLQYDIESPPTQTADADEPSAITIQPRYRDMGFSLSAKKDQFVVYSRISKGDTTVEYVLVERMENEFDIFMVDRSTHRSYSIELRNSQGMDIDGLSVHIRSSVTDSLQKQNQFNLVECLSEYEPAPSHSFHRPIGTMYKHVA